MLSVLLLVLPPLILATDDGANINLGNLISSVQEFDLGGISGCDIVLNRPFKGDLQEIRSQPELENNPVVIFNGGNQNSILKLSKTLNYGTRCAIVVANLRELMWARVMVPGLIKMSLGVIREMYHKSALIVVTDNLRAVDTTWIEKKIVFVDKGRRARSKLKVFCPSGIDSWMEGDRYLFPPCPNPLEGKTLRVAYSGFRPYVILPSQSPTGKLQGIDPALLKILAEKLKFVPDFFFSRPSNFNLTTFTWTEGRVQKLLDNEADVAIGLAPWMYLHYQFLGITEFFDYTESVWNTRYPAPKRDFIKVTKVFTWGIWVGVFSSIAAISVAFAIVHRTYSRNPELQHLVKPVVNWFDFPLLAFCTLIEPDIVPWFYKYKWSSGRFLVFIWSMYSMFNVMFYQSMLRSTLVSEDLEKPIDTHEDVLERGSTVYIPFQNHRLQPPKDDDVTDHPSQGGLTGSIREVTKLALRSGGYFDVEKYGFMLPGYAVEDILENGAVFLDTTRMFRYIFLMDERLGTQHTRISKQRFDHFIVAFWTQKDAPFMKDFNRILGLLRDTGWVEHFARVPLPLRTLLPHIRESPLEPLNFEFLWTPLFCLFVGFICSVVAFVAEIRKGSRRKKDKNTFARLIMVKGYGGRDSF